MLTFKKNSLKKKDYKIFLSTAQKKNLDRQNFCKKIEHKTFDHFLMIISLFTSKYFWKTLIFIKVTN